MQHRTGIGTFFLAALIFRHVFLCAAGEPVYPDRQWATKSPAEVGLDVIVSYNDAKLRGWTSGEKSPTNRAMKLLVEACRKKPENTRSTGMYFPPPARPSSPQLRCRAP